MEDKLFSPKIENTIFESNFSEKRDRKRTKTDKRDDFAKDARSQSTKLVAQGPIR